MDQPLGERMAGVERIRRMATPVEPTLTLGWSEADARSRRDRYRRALRMALVVDAVIGLWGLLAPTSFSSLLGEAALGAARGWVSAWGALLLAFAVLHIPGLLDPVRHRWPNVVGLASRFFLAFIYLLLWEGFLWLALLQVVIGAILTSLYYGLFRSVLMSRP